MSFLHIFVQIADGGGDTPPLSLETGPLKESSPVPFKTVDVPIGLDREVLKNLPLLKLSEECMIDDTFMDKVELEKFVHEFVVDKFTENSPSDHLERKDRDNSLSFNDKFVILLIPDNMGEMRQGFEPFVGIVDHDGEKFRDFLWGEVWIDVGSDTSPVPIMLYTDGMPRTLPMCSPKPILGIL